MDRVQEIFRGDRLIQDFGMKLIEAREGYAKVSVVVEDRFLNAHSIGHGVLLFAVGGRRLRPFRQRGRRRGRRAVEPERLPRGEARRDRDPVPIGSSVIL